MKSSLPLFFLLLLLISMSASAQFSGEYAPANWTIQHSHTTPSPNSGTVDVSGAPSTIVINGSDGEIAFDVDVDFIIAAPAAGAWSFNWAYNSNDNSGTGQYDGAYVIVNGEPQLLSDTSATSSTNQTGSFSGIAAAGDVIGFRIRSVDNVEGNAVLTISDFLAPAAELPVQLSFFNVSPSGEQVKLTWSTASEFNSDRFEVERSFNGVDFTVIASVKAAGNSSVVQNYLVMDSSPGNGVQYYRLRQVDYDGRYEYSDIKMIKWLTRQPVKIYPNPALRSIAVRVTLERNGTTNILLLDGSGRLLQQKNITGKAGSNMLSQWDLSWLRPGIYYFKIGEHDRAYRFIKQ